MQQIESDRRITINVGGIRFETNSKTLQFLPLSRLSSIENNSKNYDHAKNEYFYDRNPAIFSAVLDLCRTGELHLPSNVCGLNARSELQFWGVPLRYLDKCCWKNFYSSDNDIMLIEFLNKQFSCLEKQEFSGNKFSRIRRTVWRFFENPRSSKFAMIWYWIFMGTVFLSITIYLLDTYEVFREDQDTSVFLPSGRNRPPTTTNKNKNDNTKENQNTPNPNSQAYAKFYAQDMPELGGWKTQSVFVKSQMPFIWAIDIVCNIVFSLEFLLRLLSCPYLKPFVIDILNMADFISLMGFLIISIVNNLHKLTNCNYDRCYDGKAVYYTLTAAHFMLACRNLRFFRICRVNKGLKILFLSIDRSKKDIFLLCLVLVIMSVVFGGLVYYAEIQEVESFEYFHTCLFWAFTTMLMGGYGDTIPKTDSGCVIAAFCGLVGIVVLSMVIAVISGNFGELYARYQDRERHAKEQNYEDTEIE